MRVDVMEKKYRRYATGRIELSRIRRLPDQPVAEEDPDNKEQEASPKGKNSQSAYTGTKEDAKWWECIDVDENSQQSDDGIYASLVEGCGVFRWQNPQYASLCLLVEAWFETYTYGTPQWFLCGQEQGAGALEACIQEHQRVCHIKPVAGF